jgi:hypothetical protein
MGVSVNILGPLKCFMIMTVTELVSEWANLWLFIEASQGFTLAPNSDFTPYRVHRVPRTRHCIHSFSPGCGRRICPALTRSNHESTALKSMQADFASEERWNQCDHCHWITSRWSCLRRSDANKCKHGRIWIGICKKSTRGKLAAVPFIQILQGRDTQACKISISSSCTSVILYCQADKSPRRHCSWWMLVLRFLFRAKTAISPFHPIWKWSLSWPAVQSSKIWLEILDKLPLRSPHPWMYACTIESKRCWVKRYAMSVDKIEKFLGLPPDNGKCTKPQSLIQPCRNCFFRRFLSCQIYESGLTGLHLQIKRQPLPETTAKSGMCRLWHFEKQGLGTSRVLRIG